MTALFVPGVTLHPSVFDSTMANSRDDQHPTPLHLCRSGEGYLGQGIDDQTGSSRDDDCSGGNHGSSGRLAHGLDVEMDGHMDLVMDSETGSMASISDFSAQTLVSIVLFDERGFFSISLTPRGG